MSWLEIKLTLDGELAEPVAELLSRYAQQGAVITGGPNSEAASGEPVTVTAYLPIDDRLPAGRKAIEEGLWHLGQIQPLPEPTYTEIADQDWQAAWRARYEPVAIGRRLIIQPAWLPESDSGRLAVLIDPGMAFGTGAHPSTSLALTAIERTLCPGDRFADVGTGSGILSLAALRLGAGQAYAVDTDPRAVKLASRNARLNNLSERFHVQQGEFTALASASQDLGGFELLAANILAPVLRDLLAEGLTDLIAPAGTIVLSGVLEEQAIQIEASIREAGLRVQDILREADWLAYCLTKERELAQT